MRRSIVVLLLALAALTFGLAVRRSSSNSTPAPQAEANTYAGITIGPH